MAYSLRMISAVWAEDEGQGFVTNAFGVIIGPHRLQLRASSDQERAAWVKAISRACSIASGRPGSAS